MDIPDIACEDDGSWTQVGNVGFQKAITEYEPSIGTDFSGMLPFATDPTESSISENYDPEVIVQSAWKSLPSRELEMPWESGFWNKFLDPNVTAWDMMTRGIKRPAPFHVEPVIHDALEDTVEQRVIAKQTVEVKNFLQHIRDVPEKTWREEREAVWETAIRRWILLLEQWEAPEAPLITAIQNKESFVEKAQIMVDVFYNKAPQTLMKRVNSLAKLCHSLHGLGVRFPCNEEEFYLFLKGEASRKAPASRLKAFFESLVFCRHVLGIESLQQVVCSRRCLGASASTALSCPRQAEPFSVPQLRKLHEVLRNGPELWDQMMSGMVLFCVYGRSRWSDSQHAENLLPDFDNQGKLQFLEIQSSVHKTARAFHLSHMFLPVAAPATGVTDDCWGEQWMRVRDTLRISNLSVYPLMPAPDSALEPTRRPISTAEAKRWIHHLLGPELVKPEAKLTSHSCKCTCLSFMAKRGVNFEDRLVLGYHTNKLRMAMTYSRDSAARPLAILAQVLSEIRDGTFDPDCTRSGRLKSGAKPLDSSWTASASGSSDLHTGQKTGFEEVSQEGNLVSVESQPVLQEQGVEGSLDVDEGHVTTDSSSSSGDEIAAWAPVVGHCRVEIPDSKRVCLNSNTRMFHLSHAEHVKILLCGRRISKSFKSYAEPIRFDAAKCRQCFRLKDSSQ